MTQSLNSVCMVGTVRKIGTICRVAATAAFCVGWCAAWSGSAWALPAPVIVDEVLAALDCGSEIVSPSDAAPACGESPDAADDHDYLVETATPGYTMTLQGPEVAIGRLHPEFVHRLAGAIREARAAGLSSAGIFSAYRPPAFGVGGFSDKFNSLHTYGLAVDMTGIGGPGSVEAKTWYEIAAKHGVVCPYGVESRTEWNHCQPTWLKIVRTENPLRETVSAEGPVNLESMFQAGNAVIDGPPDHPVVEDHAGPRVVARIETPERSRHDSPRGDCARGPRSECGSSHVVATAHAHSVVLAAFERARCEGETHRHGKGCAAPSGSQTAERRATHARQAASKGARESHRV